MSILAKKSENEGNFEKTPAGTHNAVVCGVWDLGYQNTTYNNEPKVTPQAVISWEIDKLITAEGKYKNKRFVISKTYTLSFGENANLRKDLEGWFSKSMKQYENDGFDIEELIGKGCMVSIIHKESKGNVYANVTSVVALPDNMTPMTPENDTSPPEWVIKKQEQAVMQSVSTLGQTGQQVPIENEKGEPMTDTEAKVEFDNINAENDGVDLHLK